MQSKEKAKVWIHGKSGKMGQEISRLCQASLWCENTGGSWDETSATDFAAGLNSSEVILDFTSQEGNATLLSQIKKSCFKNKKILIGSTGLQKNQINDWKILTKELNLSILVAPNTSLGILLLLKSALAIAGICKEQGFDLEIEETHHRGKKDSPSGTALFLGRQIASEMKANLATSRQGPRQNHEIGIHATRAGGIYGEHKLRFISEEEELCFQHRALSRKLFAKGALVLAKWVASQPAGFFEVQDIPVKELLP